MWTTQSDFQEILDYRVRPCHKSTGTIQFQNRSGRNKTAPDSVEKGPREKLRETEVEKRGRGRGINNFL